MRDLDEREEAAPPAEEPAAGPRSFASTLAGAVLCAALVAGGAWWFAGVGAHTARELPVFRAELGPAKERPADPGGAETPYRDIRSYEVAAGAGEAAEPTLALAPPPPEPAAEDVAMAELEPASDAVVLDTGDARAGAAVAVPEEQAGTPPAGQDPPPQPAAGGEDAGAQQAASTRQEDVDRAVRLAARAALSRIQIQLGAFTDRTYTESEWRRIADQNADLLAGRALAIQPTTSGGTRFYRLRVGPFDTRDEASRVCEALQARGQDCLVAENS